MKHFYFFCLFMVLPFFLSSQDDNKAVELLDKMSDNYKKMKGFTSSFTYSMNNLNEDIQDSFEGKISVRNEKYILFIEGQKIINDSKTVWTYIEELNEVTISEFDPSEQEISLSNIFEIYKVGFSYKYLGVKEDLSMVEIYPEDEDKSYYKILFKINSYNLLESFTVYDNSNSLYIYSINDFVEEELDATLFSFELENYPDIEVIDFR